MDELESTLSESSDCNSRVNVLRNLITDHKGDTSIDLLIDIFQNLVLDCKLVAQCNSNKYLNSIYKRYEKLNEKLYSLKVKYDDFAILKVIGQGAFGQVQLVRYNRDGRLYAMKILNKSQMKVQEGSVFWKEERDIMTKIDSRWIVKMHFAFQDPRKLYMVMEYQPGGNLVTWMGRLDDVRESDVCFYTAEMVLAISTLHRYDFVHRDIKPDNMLLDARGHLKLADFGSCVRVDAVSKQVTCNRAVGTPDYISPEVLLSQSNATSYGREVDWWALGVMLYEIFFGDPPFYSETLIATYGKIMTHRQSLTFPCGEDDLQVSSAAVSLMQSLICDASDRLGTFTDASDIRAHPFFERDRSWNWEDIHEREAPFLPMLASEEDTSLFECAEDGEEAAQAVQTAQVLPETDSRVFSGENLQFAGFSYSDIFLPRPAPTKTNVNIPEAPPVGEGEARMRAEVASLRERLTACQQKTHRAEEDRHRLCADLAALQSNSAESGRRLSAQIDAQREEIDRLRAQMVEAEVDHRRSRQQASRLEADLRQLRARNEALEGELAQARRAASGGEGVPEEVESMRASLEEARRQSEISRGALVLLEADRDGLRQKVAAQEALLVEGGALRDTMARLSRCRKVAKAEAALYERQRFALLQTQRDLEERLARAGRDIAEGRRRQQTALEALRSSLTNQMAEERACLAREVALERTKCSGLVAKIDEILTGRSAFAKEMVLGEEVRAGGLGKKHARRLNDLLRANRRLQGVVEQLTEDSANADREQKAALESVCKERDGLEAEVAALRTTVVYYEGLGVSGGGDVSVGTVGSRDSGHQSDEQTGTVVRPMASRGGRGPPGGWLDLAVKVRAKKMAWERRMVKLEGGSLHFLEEGQTRPVLVIPLASIMHVRRVRQADVIHARPLDLPRIFQLIYDKNGSLLLLKGRSMTDSMTGSMSESISGSGSTLGSTRSSLGSADGQVLPDGDAVHRKGSLARLLPLVVPSWLARLHPLPPPPPRAPLTPREASEALLTRGHLFLPPLPSARCLHCHAPAPAPMAPPLPVCDQSVAVQLCRAPSETRLNDWLAWLASPGR